MWKLKNTRPTSDYYFSVEESVIREAIREAFTASLVRSKDFQEAVGSEVRTMVHEEIRKSEHYDRLRTEVNTLFDRFPAIVHDDVMLKNVVQAIMGHFQITRR